MPTKVVLNPMTRDKKVECDTAAKLRERQQPVKAMRLLAQACKVGWSALQALPESGLSDQEIADSAHLLAQAIGEGAETFLGLLNEVSGEDLLSPFDVCKEQIKVLDHIRCNVEGRLEWYLRLLDLGLQKDVSLKELASLFAGCADLLEELSDQGKEHVEYGNILSEALDNALFSFRDELSLLGRKQAIDKIVGDFCRGVPGDRGRRELRALLRSQLEAVISRSGLI